MQPGRLRCSKGVDGVRDGRPDRVAAIAMASRLILRLTLSPPVGRLTYGSCHTSHYDRLRRGEHAEGEGKTPTGKRGFRRWSIPVRGRAARHRQGAARGDAARRARRLEAAQGSARSSRTSARVQRRPNLGADPDPLRTHGPIAFRLLSRRGRGHGGRSGFDPNLRTSRAGLRRRSPYEFRRLRHAGAQHLLRHQRLR